MKKIGRARRHKRITNKIKGHKQRPRLVVFRSRKHICAQLVDDSVDKVITGYSTRSKNFSAGAKSLPPADNAAQDLKTTNRAGAKRVGLILAEQALSLGIKIVSFDRGGYKYHGRVKSLAEGAREGGLKF